MSFTESQTERYSRQLILKEIGEAGQESLFDAKVLIVGAGGLGAPVLMYLAAAGLGNISIVEPDKVELSNLHRQVIYGSGDIGRSKAEAAARFAENLNPEVKIAAYVKMLDSGNVRELIEGCDVVADCSDNFETRFLIAEECHKKGITLVSGAVTGFDGNVMVFGAGSPCYRCVYPIDSKEEELRCAREGVIGAAAGVIGTLQAMEIIKEITGIGSSLKGRMVVYNALYPNFRTVQIKADPECVVCGKK